MYKDDSEWFKWPAICIVGFTLALAIGSFSGAQDNEAPLLPAPTANVVGSTPSELRTGRGIHLTGHATALGTASVSAARQISEAPNNFVFQDSAKTVDISGAAGMDIGKTLKVVGIDSNLEPLEETVTLTGGTVTTTSLFMHVNRAVFLESVVNLNAISGVFTGGTDQAFYIPAFTSLSSGGVFYQVPDDGHAYFLRRVTATLDKSAGGPVELCVLYQTSGTDSLILYKRFYVAPDAPFDEVLDIMIFFPAGTRFELVACGNDANGGDINVAAQLVRSGGKRAVPDGGW